MNAKHETMNAKHETMNAKHETKQKSQWLMLPDEIYSHVIAFLPQTLSFGLVCKQFYTYMRRYTVIDREKLMLLFRRYSCNAKKILDDNVSKIYFHYEGKYDYFIELLPDENVEYLYMNSNIIFGDDKYYYTFAKLAAKNNNVSLFKKIVQNIDIKSIEDEILTLSIRKNSFEVLKYYCTTFEWFSCNDYITMAARIRKHKICRYLYQFAKMRANIKDAKVLCKYLAINGDKNLLESVIYDMDVDPTFDNNCLIRKAAKYGRRKVVNLLMEDFPLVDPSDVGNYALREAVKSGFYYVVRRLLMDERVIKKGRFDEIFTLAIKYNDCDYTWRPKIILLLIDKITDKSAALYYASKYDKQYVNHIKKLNL